MILFEARINYSLRSFNTIKLIVITLLNNLANDLSPNRAIKSLQIFQFYEFFCTNISQAELEILRNSSAIFRSSHRRCSIEKTILKHFVTFTGKHLCRGLFFNKIAGHQVCNFIKKRLQHRCFLANITKFIRRPVLKNIWKRAALLESVLWEHFSDQIWT